MIKALLFDLDNTLLDRGVVMQKFWRDFLDRRMNHLSPADRENLFQELMEQDELGYRPRLDYFGWVSKRIALDGWDAEKFWELYRTDCGRFAQPDPAVNAMLKQLHDGYIFVLVSNGSSVLQREKFNRASLGPLFDDVVISGECGFEKPAPEIYQIALGRAGCTPGETLFVGDDPVRDIDGAARAGCRTCWITMDRPYPLGLRRADIELDSVLDLPVALRSFISGGRQPMP